MKKLSLAVLAAILTLTLCACIPSDYKNIDDTPDPNLPAPQSVEELYSVYGKIGRDMTRAEIAAIFGEGEPVPDDYGDIKYTNYYNETKSAGASVVFDENDVILMKTLFFNNKRNLIPFSEGFDFDSIPKIQSDMPVSVAADIMGSTPLELSCTYNSDGPDSAKKIYGWYNENADNLLLHTENGIIENVVFYRN